MILQDRNLTQGLTGADVNELHNELRELGFAIPTDEQQAASFWPRYIGRSSAIPKSARARGNGCCRGEHGRT
jgi:hypothetical protein